MLTARELNSVLPYLFGNEIEELQRLGAYLPEGALVVMLGVGPGLMALALLEGAGEKPFTFRGIDNNNFTALDHLAKAGKAGRLSVSNDDTAYHARNYNDERVDLLLVDADHTYNGVMRDLKAWYPKVKSEGLILFHDYIPQNEEPNGVMEAVRDFSETVDMRAVQHFGSSLLVRKVI